MLTKKEALLLGRFTRDLIHAEIEYSWRGRGDRETIKWALENRKKARKQYFDFLKKITKKDVPVQAGEWNPNTNQLDTAYHEGHGD